jgi:antitoxin component YwqK of YwqJK toxin-antitoxin module
MAELKREYYDGSSELLSEYFEINGKKEGVFKGYYSNGQLSLITLYVDGKKNGESKSYYPNGKLSIIGTFIDDKENGEYKQYDYEGTLVKSCIYKNGVIESDT